MSSIPPPSWHRTGHFHNTNVTTSRLISDDSEAADVIDTTELRYPTHSPPMAISLSSGSRGPSKPGAVPTPLQHGANVWPSPQNASVPSQQAPDCIAQDARDNTVAELTARLRPDSLQYQRMLRIIARVTDANLASFVRALLQLVHPDMPVIERQALAAALASLPTDPEATVARLQLLLHGDFDTYDRCEIIATLGRVRLDEQPELVACVSQLLPEPSGIEPVIMMHALCEVPAGEREAVTHMTYRLITDAMSFGDRLLLFEFCAKVPAVNRKTALSLTIQTITDDMDAEGRARIILAYKDISAVQHDAVIYLTYRFITNDMNCHQRAEMIAAYAKVPADTYKAVSELAEQFIKADMMPCERSAVIETCAKVPADARPGLYERVTQFVTSHMGLTDYCELIEAWGQVAVAERQAVYQLTQKVVNPDKWGAYCGRLVEYIAKIPAAERVAVIREAKQLMTADMGNYNRATLITIINNTAPEDRTGLCKLAQPLMASEKEDNARATILSLLSKIVAGERQSMLKLAEPIMPVDAKGLTHATRAYQLAQMAPDERATILQLAKRLMRPQDIYLIKTCAQVPAWEREALFRVTHELLTEVATTYSHAELFLAFAEVPAADLKHAMNLTTPFQKPNRYGRNRVTLLKACTRLRADEREVTLRLTQQLVADVTNVDAHTTIIAALAKVPYAERATVVRLLKQYGAAKMDCCECAGLIRVIAKIPADARQTILTLSKQLISPEIIKSSIKIVKAMAEVPAHERKLVCSLTKQLVTADMDGDGRTRIISAIVRIPCHEREAMFNLVNAMARSNNISRETLPDLFLILAQVPLAECREYWDWAKELTGHRDNDSILTMLESLVEVPLSSIARIADYSMLFADENGCVAVEVVDAILKVNPGERRDVVQRSRAVVATLLHAMTAQDVIGELALTPWEARAAHAQALMAQHGAKHMATN